jgi:hypothetical protein
VVAAVANVVAVAVAIVVVLPTAATVDAVVVATKEAEVAQTTMSPAMHMAATMPVTGSTRYATPIRPPTSKTTTSPQSRLRALLLPKKFKPLEISKYDAKQDPIQWLRCYALAIKNVGGNNDTKCLYFPFCLDQAPLTWLELLDKNSTSGTS